MLTDRQTIHSDDNIAGWICDDRFFQSKAHALLYASEYSKNIQYYYNDHEFEHWNWCIEPRESLAELYRQRAQQLRDQYDHIVLMFSGGSDSTNMLRTFLDNQIVIDEVICTGAWNHVIGAMDPLNIEITVAAAPLITEIEKTKIRFTHLNLFDARERAFQHPEWVFDVDPTLCLYSDFINHALFDLPWIRALADQGKKICYIWGCEKPKIIVKQNWYYLAFRDQLMNSNFYMRAHRHELNQEFFYSHITCASLIAKQIHIILRYLESTMSRNEILNFLMGHQHQSSFDLYNSLLYADTWNTNTFTLGKHNINQYSQKWVTFEKKMKDSLHYKIWHGSIKDLLGSIDAQFLDRDQNYFKSFYKIYPIKPVSLIAV